MLVSNVSFSFSEIMSHEEKITIGNECYLEFKKLHIMNDILSLNERAIAVSGLVCWEGEWK
jgi:hypothetical protein